MAHLRNVFVALLAILVFSTAALAQGVLSGKIIDKETGEPIIGATISVLQAGSLVTGELSDFDGNYTINVDPGTYNIEFSYVGYSKTLVEGYEVKSGVNIADAAMETESQTIETVVVTAKSVKSTDVALISIQRKAFAIQDGVSSQQISRTGSSNAADAMKQMTGAVVEGGRFVVMRGLGDRYSLSQLNGITMPSTDPYRNSANLDLIPSQMIENIVTVKTFTPDMPGNFTGGLVNVNTKSFPDKLNVYFSIAQEYNTQSSLIDDFLTQNIQGSDRFGFASEERRLPSILADENIRNQMGLSTHTLARNPDPKNDPIRSVFDQTSKVLSNEFIPSLRNTPFNTSMNFSLGNRLKLAGRDLGFNLGVNYSSNYAHYEDGAQATYVYNNPLNLDRYQELNETKSTQNPQLGALFNLSYKLAENNVISANVIFNNDAEIVGRQQRGSYLNLSDSEAKFNTRTLEYTQRQLLSYQLSGRHVFSKLKNTEVEWVGALTNSFQEEPDIRYFAFSTVGEGDNTEYAIDNAVFPFPFHFFRRLDDQSGQAKLDISIPFLTKGIAGSSNKIKLGGFYSQSNREFSEYNFLMGGGGVPAELDFFNYKGDFNAFFDKSNFGIIDTLTNNGAVTRYQTGYHYINQVNRKNFYTGDEKIAAAYIMGIYNLTPRLKAILGGRYETTNLFVKSLDEKAPEGKINLGDFLYSGNLIYNLTDKMNIRLAASKTLARPNLRELAPFVQFDTKNGFFNVGNPLLKRTLIQNYDIRYEIYPKAGELIAISGFMKNFQDPIIRAFNPRASTPELSFINVDEAVVMGVELELRKSMSFLSDKLSNFFLSTNLALINSSYDIPEDELKNSKTLFPGYDITTRPFQGQAPYIVNVILSYINSDKGWESSLAYNVSGEKLYNIALFATPDVYEQPFPTLNFKASKRFADKYQVSLTARNILNPENKKTQVFNDREYIAESYRAGTGIQLAFAYILR